jgi:predicted flap endonuclease-1-like 5' DNA nuclease
VACRRPDLAARGAIRAGPSHRSRGEHTITADHSSLIRWVMLKKRGMAISEVGAPGRRPRAHAREIPLPASDRQERGGLPMSHKVAEIEGVGAANAEKLEKAGIKTVDDLLKMCCDTEGRRTVSERAGISEFQLLRWSHMADLMRVIGIGPEYSELLEAAGVLTIKELRRRNPAHLTETMKEVNTLKNLTRSVPSEKQVAKWVEKAKAMEPNVCESADFIERKKL